MEWTKYATDINLSNAFDKDAVINRMRDWAAFLEDQAKRQMDEIWYDPSTADQPPGPVCTEGPFKRANPDDEQGCPVEWTRDVDWCGEDAILTRYSFPESMARGYVTRTVEECRIDQIFRPLEPDHLVHAVAQYGGPHTPACYIHPLLHYDLWSGDLTHEDYNRLRPALVLASFILNEPSVLIFFAGLMNHPHEVINITEEKRQEMIAALQQYDPTINDIQLTKFNPPNPANMTLEKFTDIGKDLLRLRGCITWAFGATRRPDKIHAVTAPIEASEGLRGPSTSKSTITINERILSVLRGSASASDITPNTSPDITTINTPALLRIQISLAITICHELCHSANIATNPNILHEPFFRDHRLAELGNAFESLIFDGLTQPIGQLAEARGRANIPLAFLVPYGLKVIEWPGVYGDQALNIGQRLGTAAEYGVGASEQHALPMAYVRALFTQAFWDDDVVVRYPNLAHRRQDGEKWVFARVYADLSSPAAGTAEARPADGGGVPP